MFKLALIFVFASISFAKITKNDLKLFTEYDQTLQEMTKKVTRKTDAKSNETIWVLSLNDDLLDFQKLYSANEAEEKVFKNIIAPVIKNYKLQHNILNEEPLDQPESEKDKDNFENNNISDVKKEILKAMNKFFSAPLNEPVSYLSDDVADSEQKSLKLYFIGPYTSLIMTLKKQKYHYFIIPPSPLPRWFHEKRENMVENGNQNYVEIPNNVQHDFLIKFLNLLNIYTRFTI